jgi:hypothetical protein
VEGPWRKKDKSGNSTPFSIDKNNWRAAHKVQNPKTCRVNQNRGTKKNKEMEFKVISRRKSHLQNSLRLRSPSIVLHFPKSARESFGEREREREWRSRWAQMRYRPYWRTRRRNLPRTSRRSSSKSSISRPPALAVAVLCAILSLYPNYHVHRCILFDLVFLLKLCSFGVFLFLFLFSFSFYYLRYGDLDP